MSLFSSPCNINSGLYTAINGTTNPATANFTASKEILNPLSFANGAAAKQARATGGVRSAIIPK